MNMNQTGKGARFDRRAIPAEAKESYWQAPDGHPIRRIDWSPRAGTCRGSLLFLPGRTDFFEKYLETLDQWHRTGWQVTSTDWRGQAFSGRLGDDRHTGHIADFGNWIEDIEAFWNNWTSMMPQPHVIVGHSMGGHLVLRAMAEKRIAPRAAVLVAPMLGLVPRHMPLPVSHVFSRIMSRLGSPGRPAWKGSEKPGKLPEDRFDLLTHDSDRYEDELWWRRNHHELAMKAPSWGWIERSIASMRLMRRPGYLEAVDQPVLMLGTTHDGLVDYRAIEKAAGRIKNAELIVFGSEARHELLREVDVVRGKALAAIDDFLDRAAPIVGQAR